MSIFDLEKAYANWRRGLLTDHEYYFQIANSDEYLSIHHVFDALDLWPARTERIDLFNQLFIVRAVAPEHVESIVLAALITWGY